MNSMQIAVGLAKSVFEVAVFNGVAPGHADGSAPDRGRRMTCPAPTQPDTRTQVRLAWADGRTIDFAQALDLARAYARTESVSIRLTASLPSGQRPASPDPVVPDAAGTVETTEASEAKREPRLALRLDGGVLGVDRDGDGAIDPETELVNGFAELAGFDEDGNGFIDEGDPVFQRLALVGDTAEGSTAASLASRGVGAIYGGSVATPFTATDSNHQTVARLTRSGIYLTEAGTSAVIQEVDRLA